MDTSHKNSSRFYYNLRLKQKLNGRKQNIGHKDDQNGKQTIFPGTKVCSDADKKITSKSPKRVNIRRNMVEWSVIDGLSPECIYQASGFDPTQTTRNVVQLIDDQPSSDLCIRSVRSDRTNTRTFEVLEKSTTHGHYVPIIRRSFEWAKEESMNMDVTPGLYKHRNCFTCPWKRGRGVGCERKFSTPYILKENDPVLKTYMFRGQRYISPIFSHISGDLECIHSRYVDYTCEVEPEVYREAEQIFSAFLQPSENPYLVEAPHISQMWKRTRMHRGMGFSKCVDFLLYIVSNAYVNKESNYIDFYFKILNVIEEAYRGNITPGCEGFVLSVPPNMGKSRLCHTYLLGLLDTDLINGDLIDKDPMIIERLVKSGFVIISNRWEFKKWNVTKFLLRSKDLKSILDEGYECYVDYLGVREMKKEQKTQLERMGVRFKQRIRKPKLIKVDDWVRAYSERDANASFVMLIENSNIEKFYNVVLNRLTQFHLMGEATKIFD